MGNILYNGTSYGGGGSGSEVEANPSGTATDILETIGIEGTIYEIAGSGEGYSETSLWSGSDSATMQLSESFENYDAIMVIATASTQQGNYRLTNVWSVDYLKNHINDGIRFGLTGDAWYIYFSITNNTTFTRQDQYITYISEIKGLKFGGGGSRTNVEANPTDTPTDTLNTIKIGDTVFNIAGSGGLFIDTNNVIQAFTLIQDTQEHTYTATEDCAIAYTIAVSANSETFIKVDNAIIGGLYATDTTAINDVVYIKKGQTFSFQQTFTNSPKTGYTVYGIKYGSSGNGGTSSEIIPITAGDDTTSRTFTFDRKPMYVVFDYLNTSDNWRGNMVIEQGTSTCFGTASSSLPTTTPTVMMEQATWSADGKSVTITGHNSFGAINTTTTQGNMFIYYDSGTSGGSEDISDMTWTQLISQTGGSWSAATAIPSGTEYLGIAIDHSSAVYMPKTLKLSELNKYASMLNYTIVREGIHWTHDTDNDDIYYEYDSANQTIKVYAGYSGLSVKVFAIS